MNNTIDKRWAIIDAIINAALAVTEQVRQLPNTGKRNRNIFRKAYNRRPMNKQKRAVCFANLAVTSVFGAVQIARIVATPIPKYIS